MVDEPTSPVQEPSRLAVILGRIVFVGVGGLMLAVSCLFSYFNPDSRVLFTAFVMGVGFVLVWLGLVLPPRHVASLGFLLPLALPDE